VHRLHVTGQEFNVQMHLVLQPICPHSNLPQAIPLRHSFVFCIALFVGNYFLELSVHAYSAAKLSCDIIARVVQRFGELVHKKVPRLR